MFGRTNAASHQQHSAHNAGSLHICAADISALTHFSSPPVLNLRSNPPTRLPTDAQALDALAEALRNADGYFHCVVRAAAAAALGHLRDARALDALIAATQDSMAEASQEAIKALGQLGDVRALPVLREVVKNENGFFLENVRNTAQDAITRLTHKPA